MAIPRRVRQPNLPNGRRQDSMAAAAADRSESCTSTPSPRSPPNAAREEGRMNTDSFGTRRCAETDVRDPQSDEESLSSKSSASEIEYDSEDEHVRKHGASFGTAKLKINGEAKNIRFLSLAESDVITIEELSPGDIFDFSNVLRPTRVQDASSDDSDLSDSDSRRSSLVDEFENLNCGPSQGEVEFDKCYRERKNQNRKRWKKGANHKRHHDQTVGSGEDLEDVTPLDPSPSNASRRLRRRTGDPQEKPGRAQILGHVEEIFVTSNITLETEIIGSYDYSLPHWPFDSMVIDDDDSTIL